ncbi:SdpI family protein [Pseudarthrobacter sulfonivorans]|uniref:SdpI family protein n=1 Tax=Pseudarthrobacter sulfonivorans TaxID=121292 RepID=UPI00168AA24A|nr:SdpI family protein [Pseudarthrobacter sulfonivorans]
MNSSVIRVHSSERIVLGAAFSTTMFTIAFLVVAGLLQMLASQVKSGESKPNYTFGIRSKATLSSERAWNAAHSSALGALKAIPVLLLGFVATMWVIFAVLPKDDSSVPWIFFSGMGFTAIMVAMLMHMYYKADSLARRIAAGDT